MTVYANKPTFNVREKLKELDRKPGDFGNKIYQTKIEKAKWMNSRNISRFQTMAQECKIKIFGILGISWLE